MTLYTNLYQASPYFLYTLGALEEEKRNNTKDLILVNEELLEKRVSELNLDLFKLTAIDSNGTEHEITSFKKQNVTLKGWRSGRFMKSTKNLGLSVGTYTTLRLYINDQANNSVVYSDRRKVNLEDLKTLDFEIEYGLEIKNNDSCDLIFRFDLVPLTLVSYFNPLKNYFKRQLQSSTKLVRSFGNQ